MVRRFGHSASGWRRDQRAKSHESHEEAYQKRKKHKRKQKRRKRAGKARVGSQMTLTSF